MPPDTAQKDDLPQNAFLIVHGSQIFPLQKPLVTIGRMQDNDLVIDEVRISRYHAQLRAIAGQYVLVDLQSTGGTSVNGEKIGRAALRNGDVISLAGIPLIYGQNPAADLAEEPPPNPKQSKAKEQPTQAITDSTELASVDNYLDLFDDAKPGEHP